MLNDGTPMVSDDVGEGTPIMLIAGNCDTRHGALSVYKDIFAAAGFRMICTDPRLSLIHI